jgi:hypothetical protein
MRAVPLADALVLAQGEAAVMHTKEYCGWRHGIHRQAGECLMIKDLVHKVIVMVQVGIMPPRLQAIGGGIEQRGTD